MRRQQYVPDYAVMVMHQRRSVPVGNARCVVGDHIHFDSDILSSYFTRSWEPIIYDGMLLAAAVEFCDRAKLRPGMDWPRRFKINMPVHVPDQWNDPTVQRLLVRVLQCLTGDIWTFHFRQIQRPIDPRPQEHLPFSPNVTTVIPFSDGLDSLAVSVIKDKELGDKLIKVRVGSSSRRRSGVSREPFSAIPFKVSPKAGGNLESSCRSRGFKFSMITGLASYLVRANHIIVPESGLGALGPVLVNVGHGHPDRRTHPQFTALMSEFMSVLLEHSIDFQHPMLWGTKAETLANYRLIDPADQTWRDTRSCWKDARSASVNGQLRQCGICAACLIRRVSLHSSGLEEHRGTYVWNNLNAKRFWAGAHADFSQRHNAAREYALAGVLHLDHLADLRRTLSYGPQVRRQGMILSRSLGVSAADAMSHVNRLVNKHSAEWRNFINAHSRKSFLHRWAQAQ